MATVRTRAVLILAILLPACGGSGGGAPGKAVSDYAAALGGGGYSRAYDLMSDAYKRQHSRAEFIKLMQDNPDEARETARRLGHGASDLRLRADLEYGLGDHFELVSEGGVWRIATDPLDFYSQKTPRDALRTFVRALMRKRYDVVLRLVPLKWASVMTAEKIKTDFEGEHKVERKQLLERLAAHVNDRIDSSDPDHATMRYGDKYEVDFAREQGVWKIVDPD